MSKFPDRAGRGGPALAATLCGLVLAAVAAMPVTARAQQEVRLGLTRYIDSKLNISIEPFAGSAGREAANIVAEDLRFSLYFNVIDADVAGTLVRAGEGPNYEGWAAFGTRYLVTGAVDGPSLRITVHDVGTESAVFSRDYAAVTPGDPKFRAYAHAAANDIIKELTGETGIALTKIAFASRRRHEKEIYVADYDGFYPYAVTRTDTINLTPSWSPQGDRICYTTFERGNPDLFCVSTGGGSASPIATFRGLNIAPAFSPDGSKLLMTLTKDGNSEIYVMDVAAKKLTRLTYNIGIDTAPSWSPQGNAIVFESDRAGGPQIYVMDANGANVRRLSFETADNHSPAWSPKGDLIAYVGKRGGDFQIFTADAATGENLTQLTLTGSNEDPSWSPDGLHLAFSSTRAGGGSDIFTMTWDGQDIRQITRGGGYVTPDWSPLFTTP